MKDEQSANLGSHIQILLGIDLCFGALITKDCIWRTPGTTPHPLIRFCVVPQMSPSNLMELELQRGRTE